MGLEPATRVTDRATREGLITYNHPCFILCSYGQSKLAQIYFTRELTDYFENITALSVHPGIVNTKITKYIKHRFGWLGALVVYLVLKLIGKTPKEGTAR